MTSNINPPSFVEINSLLSNFNTSLADALRECSFSLQQVQAVAAAVAHSLSTLHTYENTLVPISTLPPELLIRIFESVVAPASNVHDMKPHKQAEWAITLTHVCSSWREIALGTSHLWSQVVDEEYSGHDLGRLFLHRSRSAGIRFFAFLHDFPNAPNSLWQDIFQNHFHRVRELHVQLRLVTLTENFLRALSTPLPALELLTIRTNIPSMLRGWDDSFPTPPLIFGGQALQSLKTLVLSRIFSFVPGNPLPNLVNLQLHCVGVGFSTPQNILCLLSNCPRLETLKLFSLWSSHPWFDFDQRPNPQLIVLRFLRVLWVKYLAIASTFALLSRLEFPAETTIRLEDHFHDSDYDGHPLAVSVLPAGRPSPLKHITGLTHLDIIEERAKSRDTGVRDTTLYIVAHGPRVGVWIHPAGEANGVSVMDGLMMQLLDSLSTGNIATLRISTVSALPIAHMLQRAPALSTLVLRWPDVDGAPDGLELQRSLDGLGHALAPRVDEAGGTYVPAPLLKSLTIEVNGPWEPQTGFVEALAARKLCGRSLRSFACSAKGEDHLSLMEHLMEHIETVEVTERKLWEVTSIPSVWAAANDSDGSLYLRELRYKWQVPRDTYKSDKWNI